MEGLIAPANAALKVAIAFYIVYTLCEFVYLVFIRKRESFRTTFLQPVKSLIVLILGAIALKRVMPIASLAAFAAYAEQLTPLALPDHWFSWLLALLIYEFWYWVQHFLAHKVRLLWCIHSPHHAPPTINMFVGLNHHVIEGALYLPFFNGFLPALCGVPLEVVLVLHLVDGIWGSFLHTSPYVDKKGWGWLENFMQTSSYHRAHHAQNLRYMDTNYTSITLFWDWLLGTLVPLHPDEPVRFGITREVRSDSFWDVQFGEFALLWNDLKQARTLQSVLGYLLMPPGWSPTGDHKTVAVQRKQLRDAANAGAADRT